MGAAHNAPTVTLAIVPDVACARTADETGGVMRRTLRDGYCSSAVITAGEACFGVCKGNITATIGYGTTPLYANSGSPPYPAVVQCVENATSPTGASWGVPQGKCLQGETGQGFMASEQPQSTCQTSSVSICSSNIDTTPLPV